FLALRNVVEALLIGSDRQAEGLFFGFERTEFAVDVGNRLPDPKRRIGLRRGLWRRRLLAAPLFDGRNLAAEPNDVGIRVGEAGLEITEALLEFCQLLRLGGRWGHCRRRLCELLLEALAAIDHANLILAIEPELRVEA